MAFIFNGTPEGHQYWREIADGDAPLDTAAREKLRRMFPDEPEKTTWGGYLDEDILPILARKFNDDGVTGITALRIWAQRGAEAAIRFINTAEEGRKRIVPGRYRTKDGGEAVVLEIHDMGAFGRYSPYGSHTWFAAEWDEYSGKRVDGGPPSLMLSENHMDLAERLG